MCRTCHCDDITDSLCGYLGGGEKGGGVISCGTALTQPPPLPLVAVAAYRVSCRALLALSAAER